MKLVSYVTPSGTWTFGEVTERGPTDLGARSGHASLGAFLGAGTDSAPSSREVAFGWDEVRLLPVIPDPDKIVCVGLNYSEHVEETGRRVSEYPSIFFRTRSSQTAHRQPVMKPEASEKLDFEGELAVIIGRPGFGITPDRALAHVAGYACYNDISARDWQRHTSQWGPGKNFDGTGSFGPWMVTPDEMPAFSDARLTTRLNGETMQEARLSQMIFSVEEIIAYVSTFSALVPGDVIVSGTPGGVGDRRSPPVYMWPGDVVEVEIEGIGVLRNEIVSG